MQSHNENQIDQQQNNLVFKPETGPSSNQPKSNVQNLDRKIMDKQKRKSLLLTTMKQDNTFKILCLVCLGVLIINFIFWLLREEKLPQFSSINYSFNITDQIQVKLQDRRKLPINPSIRSIKYVDNQLLNSRYPQTKAYVGQKRVILGQPFTSKKQIIIIKIDRSKQNNFRLFGSTNCAIINSVSFLSKESVLTARLFFSTQLVQSIIILSADRANIQKLTSQLSNQFDIFINQPYVDSDYKFITNPTFNCSKVVYVQGNFQFNSPMVWNLKKQLQTVRQYEMKYSLSAIFRDKQILLAELASVDLSSLRTQQLAYFVYLFDSRLLSWLTPLSFAYYARYTVEQLIIAPMLALTQLGGKLKAFSIITHSFYKKLYVSIQFQLKSVPKGVDQLCFVSYPSNPYKISLNQFNTYMESIVKMKIKNINASVIIYLPYAKTKFNIDLITFFKYYFNYIKQKSNANFANQNREGLARLKLRFMHEKALSSHAVYESSYTYCPDKSMMVASRHNAVFFSTFAQKIISGMSQKYHYIYVNVQKQSGIIAKFDNLPSYVEKKAARKSNYFKDNFQHVQIFKSDFLKTSLFWVLKSAQLQFYETQACFVFLMMEQIKLKFQYISQTLVKVYQRNSTQVQQKQIDNIKQYAEYSPLIENKLLPYKFNCLLNIAYRRWAPEKIQRKIHQIWLGNKQILPVRMALHQSIKKSNPQFQVILWRQQDISTLNFSTTFSAFQRIIEYNKGSSKSFLAMAADILRYEVIFRFGGIYIDFKMEGKKSLSPFLKYQIFYLDCDIEQIRFQNPMAVGIGVMGATKNNYHLAILLNQFLQLNSLQFGENIPSITGGFVARRTLNNQEFFTSIGLGYHLLFPKPKDFPVNLCGGENSSFDKDQQIFQIVNYQNNIIKIGLPCRYYPESYLINYTPLARSWVGTKISTFK